MLPIEEALYAYDHLMAKIRYKKTFLGNEAKLKFEDFDDYQMNEILEQADTYKTVMKQNILLATRETQVVIQINYEYKKTNFSWKDFLYEQVKMQYVLQTSFFMLKFLPDLLYRQSLHLLSPIISYVVSTISLIMLTIKVLFLS